MKRPRWGRCAHCLGVALLLLGSGAERSVGQTWAKARLDTSPRHDEYVTLHEANGRSLKAWVVYPEVSQKAPVVLLVHEIFGLSDWAREMADEVAAQGYIVIAPDLLSGLGDPAVNSSQGSSIPATGGAAYWEATPGGVSAFADQSAVIKAVSSLPDDRVLSDLNAAAEYGKHLPAASGKLFVTGFCWGGGKSFLFATQRHDLRAAFVFYGPPPTPDLLEADTTPVFGFYAGNDARITSTVPQTQNVMKAAGKTFQPQVYDGAGHGFMRAGEAPDANQANALARIQAFQRLVGLLKSQ